MEMLTVDSLQFSLWQVEQPVLFSIFLEHLTVTRNTFILINKTKYCILVSKWLHTLRSKKKHNTDVSFFEWFFSWK